MIVYGKRLYGYCDAVPGHCHVATQFVHIWFVPLVPLGSFLILEDGDDSKSGIRIGFSIKSLLFAWARAGIILSILGGLIGGIMQLVDGEVAVGIVLVVVAVVCVGFLVASYKLLSSASPARAQELLARLGGPGQLLGQLQAVAQQQPQPQQQPWQQQPQPQQQPWQQQPQPQQQPWQQQPQPQQQPWQQQPQPQQQAPQWQQPPQQQQQPQPTLPQPFPPGNWPRR